MPSLYLIASEALSPFLPLWLRWRCRRGKEDRVRLRERFGYASTTRPKGQLLWIHAASVGEATSVLPFITAMRKRFAHYSILVTTGTKTSAELMGNRLPPGVIHQYVPVDTREATRRFMRHWRPDVGLFVESEFWPNLIEAADSWQCLLGVINGRMSERSFRFWRLFSKTMKRMLDCFALVVAQSPEDGKRFTGLGAKHVLCIGNLKYDGIPLPCEDSALLALMPMFGTRPVWLAASTHPGEEAMIAKVHAKLAAQKPDLLTIIVPRHPQRGGEIAGLLQKQFRIGIRSRGDAITAQTQIYLADTLGELGLWYRACEIVFMGGSLVAHGGQNPLEPARTGCAILAGPHTHNFADIYRDLQTYKACLRAQDMDELAVRVLHLMRHDNDAQALQRAAKEWVESQSGATGRLLVELSPIFTAVPS